MCYTHAQRCSRKVTKLRLEWRILGLLMAGPELNGLARFFGYVGCSIINIRVCSRHKEVIEACLLQMADKRSSRGMMHRTIILATIVITDIDPEER